jgi:polyhydroxyalkanoate synthesis repressor PhaR
VDEEHLIRKYANRRLYDATASRHVTLEDIRNVIVGGAKVKVVDDKSGEDLTRATLLHIIASQEQFGRPVLSDQMLEAIIRFYGHPIQDMLTRYLEQSIAALLRQQKAMQAEMARVLETPTAPLAELARQNMDLWAKIQGAMISAIAPEANMSQAHPAAAPQRPKPRTPRRHQNEGHGGGAPNQSGDSRPPRRTQNGGHGGAAPNQSGDSRPKRSRR